MRVIVPEIVVASAGTVPPPVMEHAASTLSMSCLSEFGGKLIARETLVPEMVAVIVPFAC